MTDTSARVWVFFYGTFMSADVLARHGVRAREVIPARLQGFELTIRPRVNLTPSDRSCAYGAVAAVAHAELDRIYAELREQFGLAYDPRAALAETLDGRLRSALVYITDSMTDAAPDPAYVTELAACVRGHGLPEWYARHVESFAPPHGERL
jgi:cation transport regulator ChaC